MALVDSAETTAEAVADALAAKGLEADGGASSVRFFATDCRSASRASARSSSGAQSTPPTVDARRSPRLRWPWRRLVVGRHGGIVGGIGLLEVGRRLGVGGDGHLPQQAVEPGPPEQQEHRAHRPLPKTTRIASAVSSRNLVMSASARSKPEAPTKSAAASTIAPAAISFATGLPMAAPDTAKPWRRAKIGKQVEIDPGAHARRERKAHLRERPHQHDFQSDVDGGGEKRRLDRGQRVAARIERRGEARISTKGSSPIE